MRLGDVIEVNPESIRTGYPHREIEYIDISSVGTGILESIKHIPLDGAPSRAKRIVKNADTLLATVRPNLRSFLYVRHPEANTIASTGFAVLRATDAIDPRFLYYTVTNQPFTDYLTANAKGAAYPAVDTDTIERSEIYLPSLPIQQKIAAILSTYDDLIENNLRRIKILESMAQNLYREWFVKFHFSGHEQVRMVDSPLGKIPESWWLVNATDAIAFKPKITLPKEGLKPFVPMNCLSESSMVIDGYELREGNSGAKFCNGDTLFARITPCLENGKTGFVQFLSSSDTVGFGSTEFIVMRSKTVSPEFVYLMARSDSFRDNAIKSMSGATGRQRVREACFETFYFPHPDDSVLTQFNEIVNPMFKSIFNLDQRIHALSHTRDLLLPKLFSGELDVSELNIETGKEAA